MNEGKIDIDIVIDQTGEKIIDVLSRSGLTVGIMMLIIRDIMHTLEIQKTNKMMKAKEDSKS